MIPLKFVHMADVHLDAGFYSRQEGVRKRLRDAVRIAFQRGVDLCIDQQVHCLLIAGDLFDGQRLSFETEKFLIENMNRLNEYGIQVFYCTGNHDPGGMGQYSNVKWPSNVRVFGDEKIETAEIKNREGRVVGRVVSCGHGSRNLNRNLVKDFPQAQDDVCHIGLVHAMVTGAASLANHCRYAPCSLDDLMSKEYHYWALGHIHTRQQMGDGIYYPGNIQGRHPGETGDRGCYLVEVYPGGIPHVEFCPLAAVKWHQLTLDNLADVSHVEELEACIIQLCNKALEDEQLPARDHIMRIYLTGSCPLYDRLEDEEDVAFLEEQITYQTGVLSVEILSGLRPPVVADKYINDVNLLAHVLNLIEEAELRDDVLERLIPDQLAAGRFADSKERLAYARSLLKGLKQEAVARMVVDGE
ncbi:MAG TPA: DNA repair exonuclease [Clostridiales bacterium]|nr:DNA repair exonuclease [Clostridiales bacterium]